MVQEELIEKFSACKKRAELHMQELFNDFPQNRYTDDWKAWSEFFYWDKLNAVLRQGEIDPVKVDLKSPKIRLYRNSQREYALLIEVFEFYSLLAQEDALNILSSKEEPVEIQIH